ncbi:MAG: hypothetical protein MI892_30505 [Desulfobacterales bacterium]|nr:hypothetical protein [Desulfobacterales bacterium]
MDESPNALRIELSKFEKANMLLSKQEGNKKIYRANTGHPLFLDIRNIIMKTVGFDRIIDDVISRMGDVEKVYVLGNLARGIDSKIIDLLFVGEEINTTYLIKLLEKVEKLIERRIRYLVIDSKELMNYIHNDKTQVLLLWDMQK